MPVNPISFPGMQVSSGGVDFSSLAQLPQVYRQAQAEQVRRQTLAELGQGGQVDPMRLIQSGDMSLANLGFQQMARQEAAQRQAAQDAYQRERAGVEDKFRQQQLGQTAAYQNRSLGIQEQNAAFQREQSKDKPTIQKVKDAAGNETLLQVYPDGRTRALSPGEAAAAANPNNPFAADGKQTEGQANAGLYAGRMFQAEAILRDPKVEAAAQSRMERAGASLPGAGKMFNLNSNEFQKFDQAQRNFINAVLRRESGAVISEQEFDNAKQQYFPAPGDTPDRLAQKRANRAEAIKGISAAAGPSWRAPAVFDAEGNLRPYGKGAVAVKPAGGPKPGTLEDGFRFKGGDPADPKNWVKAQ